MRLSERAYRLARKKYCDAEMMVSIAECDLEFAKEEVERARVTMRRFETIWKRQQVKRKR
jgi:hypothetical protein